MEINFERPDRFIKKAKMSDLILRRFDTKDVIYTICYISPRMLLITPLGAPIKEEQITVDHNSCSFRLIPEDSQEYALYSAKFHESKRNRNLDLT